MSDREHDGPSNSERGHEARWPSHIPARGWKDIAWRVWREIAEDRILLIAAGVTYYLLLALFPALGAFVSLYGLFADPATVSDHIALLEGVLPSEAITIIEQQLDSLARQDQQSLGIGFAIGLAIALWSTNGGVKSLFEAMNVAYDETEKRGFVRLNLVSLAFALGAILIMIGFILIIGIIPAVLAYLNLDRGAERMIELLRWPVLLIIILAGVVLLYRFGPSRARAKWRWLSWGAVFSTLVWLGASWAFGFYLQNFANYNATYGSLGTIIGLMVWIWISVTVLIMGAEINAEIEHQTKQDSTIGAPRPMGERGAFVADTVGDPADKK